MHSIMWANGQQPHQPGWRAAHILQGGGVQGFVLGLGFAACSLVDRQYSLAWSRLRKVCEKLTHQCREFPLGGSVSRQNKTGRYQ